MRVGQRHLGCRHRGHRIRTVRRPVVSGDGTGDIRQQRIDGRHGLAHLGPVGVLDPLQFDATPEGHRGRRGPGGPF